jgi:DNA sulfur modification protein DndD
MSEEDIRELKAEIESSESRYNRYAENKKRMDVLHKEIRFLSDILNWSSSNLAETIEKYYDGEYAVVDHKKQLDEHDKLLKDSGHDVISEITKQIEEEVKNGASHEGTINKLKDEERFWNKKYDDCIKKLKGSENISSLSRKYDSCYTKTLNIVDGLERVIEKGIRTKRDSILRNANTVFKKLTNKSNIYEGLEYESDKTYAFAILKKSGGRAKNPSAGETQVIAMSFLIALTMCTERNSPILMDTPLAKLDEVHASNVGDMLASLDNQILFLAQPMELSPHVMEGLKRSIAKQFALKLTDDNNAEILEVRT